MPNGIKILGGSANPELVRKICENLGIEQSLVKVSHFADGEIYPQIVDNIRGADVFVIQSTCAPANDNLMELMLLLNAAKLASAKRLTGVIPYFAYARQDRKDRPRVPISAKVVATMIQSQRIKRLLTMDLHSAPIQGFFDIPVDHLYALPVFLDKVNQELTRENLVIVSPDAGGVTRARLMAMKLDVPLAIVDKYREAANVSKIMHVIGEVSGKDCLLVDDMADTGGTLCKGAVALLEKGAKSVRAACTHAVLSTDKTTGKSAYNLIDESPLKEVWVTDTIPLKQNSSKIQICSVAPLFAEGIKAVWENLSVSGLFA